MSSTARQRSIGEPSAESLASASAILASRADGFLTLLEPLDAVALPLDLFFGGGDGSTGASTRRETCLRSRNVEDIARVLRAKRVCTHEARAPGEWCSSNQFLFNSYLA